MKKVAAALAIGFMMVPVATFASIGPVPSVRPTFDMFSLLRLAMSSFSFPEMPEMPRMR